LERRATALIRRERAKDHLLLNKMCYDPLIAARRQLNYKSCELVGARRIYTLGW
jgi:hypothetical protein